MQSVSDLSNRNTLQLVVTWVLMVPLMFFAIDGAIRFDAYSRNNTLASLYTSLIPSQSEAQTRIAIVIVFSLCALLFCTRLRGLYAIAKENPTFVILAMLAITSSLWSQLPKESLKFGVFVAVNVCFAFFLAARFTPEQQMRLFQLLGWCVILSSIFAALMFPQYGMDNQGEGVVGAWIGIFPHKNWCSIMVAFLLAGAFYLKPTTHFTGVTRPIYILLSLFVIYMSQSRTGWIVAASLILYVCVTKYLRRYQARDRLLITFASSGLAIVAVSAFVQYYTTIMFLLGKDPTLTGRTKIWTLALYSAMKRPLLGYGYHAFWNGLQGESANISLADRWIVPAAHNGFLDLWLGLGLIGLALVMYSLVKAVRDSITCHRVGSSPAMEWYLCLVFVTVVSNIAELTLMVPNYLAWILYVLACVGLAQQGRLVRVVTSHE